MALSAKSVNDSGIEMRVEGGNVIIAGNVEVADPGKIMGPFFKEVHQNILENNMKGVKVDITNLTFLNSSGIKEFVDWVIKLEDLSDDQRYKITFLCNPDLIWQESSISTIELLNSDYISKEGI